MFMVIISKEDICILERRAGFGSWLVPPSSRLNQLRFTEAAEAQYDDTIDVLGYLLRIATLLAEPVVQRPRNRNGIS